MSGAVLPPPCPSVPVLVPARRDEAIAPAPHPSSGWSSRRRGIATTPRRLLDPSRHPAPPPPRCAPSSSPSSPRAAGRASAVGARDQRPCSVLFNTQFQQQHRAGPGRCSRRPRRPRRSRSRRVDRGRGRDDDGGEEGEEWGTRRRIGGRRARGGFRQGRARAREEGRQVKRARKNGTDTKRARDGRKGDEGEGKGARAREDRSRDWVRHIGCGRPRGDQAAEGEGAATPKLSPLPKMRLLVRPRRLSLRMSGS